MESVKKNARVRLLALFVLVFLPACYAPAQRWIAASSYPIASTAPEHLLSAHLSGDRSEDVLLVDEAGLERFVSDGNGNLAGSPQLLVSNVVGAVAAPFMGNLQDDLVVSEFSD